MQLFGARIAVIKQCTAQIPNADRLSTEQKQQCKRLHLNTAKVLAARKVFQCMLRSGACLHAISPGQVVVEVVMGQKHFG